MRLNVRTALKKKRGEIVTSHTSEEMPKYEFRNPHTMVLVHSNRNSITVIHDGNGCAKRKSDGVSEIIWKKEQKDIVFFLYLA